MLAFLDSISESGWAVLVRDSNGVWGYVLVLVLHTFGMILLVGISTAIALRTLGVASDLPIAPLRKYAPLMWLGLGINAATGVVLFFLDGRNFTTNPDYWIKMTSVVGAVTMSRLLLTYLGDPAIANARSIPSKGKTLARGVIACWLVAVTAGRLTAYDRLVEWQSAVAVFIVMVVLAPAVWFLAPGLFSVDKSAQQARGVR